MSNEYLGEGRLLQYNSVYGVLICRECEYAIQKSAIDSHLLKHKIYRGDRQDLLAIIAKLNILEPDDVPQPYSGDHPIEGLPVLSGYKCKEEACEHLTISEKRIRRHWSDAHGQGESLPQLSNFTCRVHLQTFFRGTKLRYFEVAPVTPGDALRNEALPEELLDNDGNTQTKTQAEDEPKHQDVAFTISDAAMHPLIAVTSTLNLTIMNYFYHFLTGTSHTLPGSESYWHGHIIPIALRHEWLLYGLLAIAARHMMTLAIDDLEAIQDHLQHVDTFTYHFDNGLTQSISSHLITSELGGDTIETALRVKSLLKLSQIADPIQSLGLPQDIDYISLIKDCCATASQAGTSPLLVTDSLHTTIDNTPPQLYTQLDTLSARMAPILGKPDSSTNPFVTIAANVLLVKSCKLSFAHDTPKDAWNGMELWLVQMSSIFQQMLARHDPPALLVLAHWASVLVRRAETLGCWYLKTVADSIIAQVRSSLSFSRPTVLCLLDQL